MKRLLCLPSTYLGLPILLACGLTLLTYDLSVDYLQGLLLLAVVAAAIMLFDVQAGVRIPPPVSPAIRPPTPSGRISGR